MSRKSLSKSLRFEVFKRDQFTCQYCGAHPPSVILHCDHIHPVAKGGTNDIDNLITSCITCNQGKAARSLSSVPVSLKDKAALVATQEEQIAGYEAVMRARRERLEDETWEVAERFMELYNLTSIPKVHLVSIRRFIEKQGVTKTLEAMDIANRKKPYSDYVGFKFFCGVCWNMIRDSEGGHD